MKELRSSLSRTSWPIKQGQRDYPADLMYLLFRSSTPWLPLFLLPSKRESLFFLFNFSSFFPISLGISVERNEGFLLLKGEGTELTLCINWNDFDEVDLPHQQGSLWSEWITETAVHYFLWSRHTCLLPSGLVFLSSLILAWKLDSC